MRCRPLSLLAALLVVAGGLLIGPGARAITLVPPTLEFSANPGDTLKTQIKLFNESTGPITLFTSTANFTAGDETGTPKFDDVHADVDLAGWFTIPAGPLTLQANDRSVVDVTINVPKNADPGGHYAAVFFGNQPENKAAGGGTVNISSKVGTLVLVRVAGDIREAASIKEFTAGGAKTMTRRPVIFNLRLHNDGNVHLRPTGSITIRNMMGGVAATLQINPDEGAVLPASTRHFSAQWNAEGQAERGNFFREIKDEFRNFGFGTYTAEANIAFGQSKQNLIATAKFTIFPWHALLVIVIGIVALVFLITWLVTAYNRMIISRAQKGSSGPRPPRN